MAEGVPGPSEVWRLRTRSLDLSRGVLMGIVNVSPDSFSGDGISDTKQAVEHGLRLVAEGAELIDVGGESTRPGSRPVDVSEELRRVKPVITALVAAGVSVSVDTSKPEVAQAGLDAGAEVINDVNGARAEGMVEVLAQSGAGLVIMHMRGEPRTMHEDPSYDDVVGEVEDFLLGRTAVIEAAGVDRTRVAIDPGLGFGKTITHNLQILRDLDRLASHPHPVVLGASRKRFLGTIAGGDQPADRDDVTAVTTALGFAGGARIFRVHNVAASRRALAVSAAIVAPLKWDEWLLD